MKKMTRLLIYIALSLTVCGLGFSAFATGERAGNLTPSMTWTLEEDGTLSIAGSGDMPDYSFANAAPWDAYRTEIVRVVLQEGVTSAGSSAFSGCAYLRTAHLPNTLKNLGNYAFFGCESLSVISVPATAEEIGEYAFAGCEALSEISFPDSLKKLGEGALQGTKSLREVRLPSSLSSISGYLFYGSGIENVEIPGKVKRIEQAAFADAALRTIRLPASLTAIEASAFAYSPSLTDVHYAGSAEQAALISIGSDNQCLLEANWHYVSGEEEPSGIGGTLNESIRWSLDDNGLLTIEGRGEIPDFNALEAAPWQEYSAQIISVDVASGITKIGGFAFSGCDRLIAVSIAGTVTHLGEYAFNKCASLPEITIPDTVAEVGNYAFTDCTALSSVVLPDTLSDLGEGAFVGTESLAWIALPESLRTVSGYLFYNSGLQTIAIPEGVTAIESAAFAGAKLTAVSLPESVKNIGQAAFGYLDGLTRVAYAGKKQAAVKIIIGSGNECLLEADWECADGTGKYPFDFEENPGGTTTNRNPINGMKDVFRLPASTVVIGAQAFQETAERAVIIPEGVEIIESKAFANSPNLIYVQIPESITSIAFDAFSGSEQVTLVVRDGGSAQEKAEKMGFKWIAVKD